MPRENKDKWIQFSVSTGNYCFETRILKHTYENDEDIFHFTASKLKGLLDKLSDKHHDCHVLVSNQTQAGKLTCFHLRD